MKKPLIIVAMLLVACSEKPEYRTPYVLVHEQDLGIVKDVWGCVRGGYGNQSILCNVETNLYKFSQFELSSLKVPYVGVGDKLVFKTYKKGDANRYKICINDVCSESTNIFGK